MLWHKAWLETRWRFISALAILTVLAAGDVYEFVASRQLLPMVSANLTPTGPDSGLAGIIREAIEVQKDFRGFIWYQAFRSDLTSMGVLFAVLLGCGGLLSESSRGSALFTLALPVTRRELVGARVGMGLAQCFAIAMVPPLVYPVLAPTVGQRFSLIDSLAHGVCLFVVGALFFSLASFLSTLFADIWRPLLISIGVACFAALLQAVVPDAGIFRVMSGESWFRTGALPWMGFVTSAVLATALLYSAAETLERRDF